MKSAANELIRWRGLDTIKLAHTTHVSHTASSNWQPTPLTDLGQYANNRGRRLYTTTLNSPFLPQQRPTPSPVLIAPTHGGMARLSGLDECGDGRLAKGHQSHFNPVLTGPDVKQLASLLQTSYLLSVTLPCLAPPGLCSQATKIITPRFTGCHNAAQKPYNSAYQRSSK